jgi:aquaporin related protein
MKLKTSGLFDNLRDDCLVAAALEFIGTMFFLLFVRGGIQAATADSTAADRPSSTLEQVFYISTCMVLGLLNQC